MLKQYRTASDSICYYSLFFSTIFECKHLNLRVRFLKVYLREMLQIMWWGMIWDHIYLKLHQSCLSQLSEYWWMADFNQVPNTVLYDWCSYTLTLLSIDIEPLGVQWFGNSVVSFDSQLELRIFLSVLVLDFFIFQIIEISVLTWYFSGDSNLLTSEGWFSNW